MTSTPNTRGPWLHFCAIAAITALAVLAIPATSRAVGSVILKPCSAGATLGFGSFSGGGGAWTLEPRCASEVTLTAPAGQAPTGSSLWTFPASATNRGTFSAISMDVTGGDNTEHGRNQHVKACTPAGVCGTPQSAGGEVHRDLTVGADIPVGADRLRFSTGCLAAPPTTCSADSPTRISNLEITIADTTKPSISFSPVAPTTSALQVRPDDWNGGIRELRIRATDVGTGVRLIRYQLRPPGSLYGPKWEEGEFGCGVGAYVTATIPYLCRQSTDHSHSFDFSGPMSVFGIEPGLNRMSATAVDAAGNESDPLEFDVYLDHTDPVVTNLRVTPEKPSEWQSGVVGVRWDYVGDPNSSDTESGLDTAKFTVTPEEQGIGNTYSFETDATENQIADLGLPGPGRWKVELVVTDKAGNESEPVETKVRVDTVVPGAPAIDPIGAVSADALEAGHKVTWARPENESEIGSGICSFAVLIDKGSTSEPIAPGAVSGDVTAFELPSYIAEGDYFFHVRAISCSGVSGETAHRSFQVRTSAPAVELSKPDSHGWHSPEGPLIARLSSPKSGDEISVAPLGAPDEWTAGPAVTAALTDGEQTVVVRSRDELGNTQTIIHTVRFDGSAPSAVFDAFNPAQPTVVTATTSDSLSGVVEAGIQFRALGSGAAWTNLPVVADATGQSSRSLRARFPDEISPDGTYELRVVTRDLAGNVYAGGIRADSSPAHLQLPLRAMPSLTGEFRQSRIAYGASAVYRGRIVDGRGDALAGAELTVLERVGDSPERQVGSIRSDAGGRFTYAAKAGPSRRLTVRFAGSERDRPVETGDNLLVSAGVTLRVARKRIEGGWRLVFRGGVKRLGAAIPRSGKVVEIQFRAGGQWRRIDGALAGASGRFETARLFQKPERPLRYRFRARVPAGENWAYAAGHSKTVTVVLR